MKSRAGHEEVRVGGGLSGRGSTEGSCGAREDPFYGEIPCAGRGREDQLRHPGLRVAREPRLLRRDEEPLEPVPREQGSDQAVRGGAQAVRRDLNGNDPLHGRQAAPHNADQADRACAHGGEPGARVQALAGYGSKRNGGYWSVTSRNAYASTRAPQRPTPSTNVNNPRGYRPVNKMANHAMTTETRAPIPRNTNTM